MDKKNRATGHRPAPETSPGDRAERNAQRRPDTSSREVDWFAVAQFVAPLIAGFDRLPIPGTPAWCELSDHDPVKLAACLLYVRYWAFDAACRQETEIQASHDISAAADWAAIGRRIRDEAEFYRDHPHLKRAPA